MTSQNTPNLIDGLHSEMNRVREVIDVYNDIPAGAFAIAIMKNAIREAEESISSGDVIRMLRAYEELKEYTL